jgi:CRP/FNR family transcriptional regulator, cyclic AMP receptor protein
MHATLNPTVLPAVSVKPSTLEDPLDYIPCSAISEYRKGEAIYTHGQSSNGIYLVVKGKVKILRQTSRAGVVVDVYGPNEFFGESALAGHAHRTEEAVALERTSFMSWSREEIEEEAALRPKLAIALLQLVVRRSLEFADRIVGFSVESIEQRLARTLVRFAGRFGSEAGDGTLTMDAFTHKLLSQYVGASRAIVTRFMSQFRREGYVQYSRKVIALRQRALIEWQTAPPTAVLKQSAASAN